MRLDKIAKEINSDVLKKTKSLRIETYRDFGDDDKLKKKSDKEKPRETQEKIWDMHCLRSVVNTKGSTKSNVADRPSRKKHEN